MSVADDLARARSVARDRFVEIVSSGEPIALDEAVAWFTAEERPAIDVPLVLESLGGVARGVRMPPVVEPVEAVARLNVHLFQDLGFQGDRDHYEQPRNSLLDQVLERRLGLPILLCVVYLEVARRLGVGMEGVGFPGHFLVRPADASPPFFVDPFNGGRILRREELEARLVQMRGGQSVNELAYESSTRTVPPRYILVRIANNLKGAYLRQGDVPGALRAVERLVILSPELDEELRDRGLMRAHVGQRSEAIEDLEAYLEARPRAPDRDRIEARIAELMRPSKS